MEPSWSPVVATDGNQWQIGSARKPEKQAKTVATGCHQLAVTFMVRRGSTLRPDADHSPSHTPRPSARLPFVLSRGNGASRTDPAGGPRKLPPIPANPRNPGPKGPAHTGNPRLSPLNPEAP